MKQLLLLTLSFILLIPVMAQEAIRKELKTTGMLTLTAYYFFESNEYLFTLNGKYKVSIEKTEGSFVNRVEIFSGNEWETRQLLDDLAEFMKRNSNNKEAAFRIGNTFLYRKKGRNRGYNYFELPSGHFIGISDKDFDKFQESFSGYWEDQEIGN